MNRAVHYLLFVFAFLWPWGVYQNVPGLNVRLTQIAAVVLVVTFFWEIVARRRARVPFELVWPAVLLAAIAVVASLRGGAALALDRLLWCALFVATVHVARPRPSIPAGQGFSAPPGDSGTSPNAQSTIQERDLIAFRLWISSVSGACVALLTLLLPVTRVIPTAYSLDTGAMLAFDDGLAEGCFALLICLVLAVGNVFATHSDRWPRAISAMSAVPLLGALAIVVVPSVMHVALWRPPDYAQLSRCELAWVLMSLWLVSRTAAKIAVDRCESGVGIHATLLGAAAVMAVFPVFLSVALRLEHAFLLGLACAYVLPASTIDLPGKAWAGGWQWLSLAPVVGLIGFNLWWVDPENPSDPRNYDAVAGVDFAKRRLGDVVRRMEFIERRYPAESRTRLWLGRVELDQGWPHRAALEFCRALNPPQGLGRILPLPSKQDQQDFLMRIRDHCSSLARPESAFAYERALVAAGGLDSALNLLRLHAARARDDAPDAKNVPQAQLVRMIAFLLGSDDVEPHLDTWSKEELIALLGNWGAVIERAPKSLDDAFVPLMCAAQYGANVAQVLVLWGADAGSSNAIAHAGRIEAADLDWRGGGWSAPTQDAQGRWRVALGSPPDNHTIVEVCLDPGTQPVITSDLPDGLCLPDPPAIRVWLPGSWLPASWVP